MSSPRMLTERDKSVPPSAHGTTVSDFLAARPHLSDFATPILTLDRGALDHNVRVMREWLAANGLQIAPHGKTTMAPALWRDLMDAGAWGLTVATAWQAGVARAAGIRRIMIANTVVDPVGVEWLCALSRGADEPEVISWVDATPTVRMLDAASTSRGRRLPVIAELGGLGGRTGARGVEVALAVARAVAASDNLELAGVGGYEGALGHDRSADAVSRVDAYLDELRALHVAVAAEGLYRGTGAADSADPTRGSRGPRPIVTAGGSAYLDRVAARLGGVGASGGGVACGASDDKDPSAGNGPSDDNGPGVDSGPGIAAGSGGIADADVVLRSGAYQVHDDGYYSRVGPMGTITGTESFRSAMHLRARVVSRPEPGLAILDAGRRDLPFDEGLPVPQAVVGGHGATGAGAPAGGDCGDTGVLAGAEVVAVNDQHAFLRLGAAATRASAGGGEDQDEGRGEGGGTGRGEGADSGRDEGAHNDDHEVLPIGSVVRLGLSHPCTALDKWRLVPIVDDALAEDPLVIDLIETVF